MAFQQQHRKTPAPVLTHHLDLLFDQLTMLTKGGYRHNEVLFQELAVLREDEVVKARIGQLYKEKRLPPVTGPAPNTCGSCGKPIP